ncbi:hypothetical protein, partial [Pontibacter harenae]|uniref:hypothetical protein n=1 Tax=Pontibacter harenae TaxID=2894083 RepID=UPI001E3F140A
PPAPKGAGGVRVLEQQGNATFYKLRQCFERLEVKELKWLRSEEENVRLKKSIAELSLVHYVLRFKSILTILLQDKNMILEAQHLNT